MNQQETMGNSNEPHANSQNIESQPSYGPPSIQTPIVSHNSSKPKKGILKKLFLILLTLITLGAVSTLGYLYYDTSKMLSNSKSELTATLSKFAALEEDKKQAVYADRAHDALVENAKRECFEGSKTATVFNKTVGFAKMGTAGTRPVAVGQFVCMNGKDVLAKPIRFIAVQSYDDGATWEMTYGSSTSNPYELPNWIYETNPKAFDRAYNNPTHR